MHILEKEKYNINNLSFHLRKLEKEEKIQSKVSRRKADIKNTENKVSIEKINRTKSQYFKKNE